MITIRRTLAVALVALFSLALLTPAAGAHEDHRGGKAPTEMYGGEPGSYEAGNPHRNGVDGTEPIAFAALLVAGIATVGAVAALIFGPRRVPV